MNDREVAKGEDKQHVGVAHSQSDAGKWSCHWTLEKFHEERDEFQAMLKAGKTPKPYEVIEGNGNLLVNLGIQEIEDAFLTGSMTTPFNNTNSGIAVGTSATAADPTDTGLGAENDRKGMEATFPSRTNQTITFKSVFDDAGSDGVWAEWGIFNNPSTGGTMLNHKIAAMGTKSGGTWTLTVTITIS